MKHPVQIKTRLVCRGEEGEETIERTYRGTWARRDSRHLLHYADEENCGETHVLLSPLQADLRRRGQAVSRMVLAEGFLHESPYATPAGTFPLGVRTESYGLGLTPTGGRLHAVYTIEMGGVAVSRNELWLTWNYLN